MQGSVNTTAKNAKKVVINVKEQGLWRLGKIKTHYRRCTVNIMRCSYVTMIYDNLFQNYPVYYSNISVIYIKLKFYLIMYILNKLINWFKLLLVIY